MIALSSWSSVDEAGYLLMRTLLTLLWQSSILLTLTSL